MAKILIAGEDLASVDQVSSVAESEGYEVLTAMTGLDVCEIALAEAPDLIMLEPSLPVYNGFETCVMLREDPESPERLPIIFLTSDTIDARQMESVDATDQIAKTHESVELADMLIRHLGDKAR